MTLRHEDHARDAAGLLYVYPVVSRRAEGVSVGINLNTNDACNWRCVYCQVPGLVRGKAPEVDLARLERELRGMLAEIARTDWLARNAPEGARRLNDVAFSGNGEPTSSPRFAEAVERKRQVDVRADRLVVEGVTPVRFHQQSSFSRIRDFPERRVAPFS